MRVSNADLLRQAQTLGYSSFRPGQLKAVKTALSGKKLLLIQPTGWGKTVIYQMVALNLGLTVVFTPLKALMRDQIERATRAGLRAELLNSDQDRATQRAILQEAQSGKVQLLFIAPERLQNQLWQNVFPSLPIKAVAIDEAHCISIWGHDFRPEYQKIGAFVKQLPRQTPLLAVTATATKYAAKDIKRQLGRGVRIQRGRLSRPNLHFSVIEVKDEPEKFARCAELVQRLNGTGLIYVRSKQRARELACFLQSQGVRATFYHAGRTQADKRRIEWGLLNNHYQVVVSTSALGMGFDKPDIRYVIHADFPDSPLNYVQESGRAGRDGAAAEVILLASKTDIAARYRDLKKQEHDLRAQIDSDTGEEAVAKEILQTALQEALGIAILPDPVGITISIIKIAIAYNNYRIEGVNAYMRSRKADLDAMVEYPGNNGCRSRYLTTYLGDRWVSNCRGCDNCLGRPDPPPPARPLQEAARRFKYDFEALQVEYVDNSPFLEGYCLKAGSHSFTTSEINKAKQSGAPIPASIFRSLADMARLKYPLGEIGGVVGHRRSGAFVNQLATALGLPAYLLGGAFPAIPAGDALIVVDYIYDQGTMFGLGSRLRDGGSGSLYPLTALK